MLICEPQARSGWWYLKIVLGCALILNLFLAGSGLPWFRNLCPSVRIAGQCLAVAGGLIHIYHFFILSRAGSIDGGVPVFVDRGGLFRFVRHPMYFGDALLYAGLAATAGNLAGVILLAAGLVSIVRQCRFEDALLGRRFDDAHGSWKTRTRLIVPGLY